MNVSLICCMMMMFIGLAVAMMAFSLFRVAIVTNSSEKSTWNRSTAAPGLFFAVFSAVIIIIAAFFMYSICKAVDGISDNPKPGDSVGVLAQQSGSVDLPLVVGQVVVTKLPEFAFTHSDGSGIVEIDALVIPPSSGNPDEKNTKTEEDPPPAKKLVPLKEAEPWRSGVASTDQAATHTGNP